MKKILLILISLMCIYAFYKNHDYRSITQVTYVNSIGVDYKEDSKEFVIYFYVLNNFNIAQTGNSASFTNTHSYIAKASDKDLLSAENKLRNNSNTKFDLSHVRSLIIKDSFFVNDNIVQLVNYFQNNSRFNPSFKIYTTSDELDKIFKIENFSEVSGYYTILVNTQNNIPVGHITYKDLCNDIFIPNYTVAYQKIKINDDIISDDKEKYITLEYDGCTFLNDNLQSTTFKYQNLHGIAYFTTKINRPMPIEYENINFNLAINTFKVKHSVINNKLIIKIMIDGNVLDNTTNLNSDMLKKTIENKFKKDILEMNDTFISYDIDFFNIAYKYKNRYDYKTIPLEFDFSVKISN